MALKIVLYFSLFLSFILMTSCKQTDQSSTTTSTTHQQESYQKVAQYTLTQLFTSRREKSNQGAQHIAQDLMQDRAFILAYFLDHSYQAPEITSTTQRYQKLTQLPYISLVSPQGILSQAGELPLATASPALFTLDTTKSTLYFTASAPLSKGSLAITTATTLTQEDITNLYNESAVSCIINYQGLPLFVTPNLNTTIGMIDSTHAIIEGDTLQTHRFVIDANISVLLFLPPSK